MATSRKSSLCQSTRVTMLTYVYIHFQQLRLLGYKADALTWSSRLVWPLLLFCKNPSAHHHTDALWSTVLAQRTALLAKQALLPWNEHEACGWDFHFPLRCLETGRVRRQKSFLKGESYPVSLQALWLAMLPRSASVNLIGPGFRDILLETE